MIYIVLKQLERGVCNDIMWWWSNSNVCVSQAARMVYENVVSFLWEYIIILVMDVVVMLW